ncbi:UNVERIFIED_CONTAM: hypothetical protein GTU68_039137 [Idotea baltica]|nr:hypothetical protein [Idotea baltica]
MFDSIIAYSIKQKFVIGLLVVALIAWGMYSLKNLPIDALPDITNNQVQIITTAPNLATQEVELFITYPIELAIKSIPEIVELRSVSRFGLSLVTVVFEEQTDIYWARNQISERLKEAEEQIPEGFGVTELAPISTGLGEIYQYTVSAEKGFEEKLDIMELRSIQDWLIVPQLLGTRGVAEVNTLGGVLKEYEVSVDPDRLKSMGITMVDIFDALNRNNENTGGAYIDKKPYAYFIRSIGMVSSLEDISKIVIKTQNNIPILIRDVAEVQFGNTVRYGATTKDGKGEVVNGMIMMLKGENSADIVALVKDRFEEIVKNLPEGVKVEPYLDRSKLVNRTISTVQTNLLEGALIVLFILVLLIGNWRAGLIVASVIPLALLFAVAMMRLFGVSGNLMSLGAIDFGLIVDGAVIIVESIVHRLQTRKSTKPLSSGEMDEAVYQASSKIRSSAAFGEIIILIVYLPILALVGIEGKMFTPMAQTVAFAILGAFILSLTYVPMMSALCLSKKVNHKLTISDKIIAFFQKLYTPILNVVLRFKILVLLLTAILFGYSLFVFSTLGGEFIPNLSEGDIATHIIIPPGSSLSQEIETTTKAEKILLDHFPEIEQIVSKIGSAEVPTDPMPMEVADMIIIMKDKKEWEHNYTQQGLYAEMEKVLDDLPGVTTEFSQPIQMRFNELMTGVRSDVGIKIFGDDIEQLVVFGDELVRIVQGVSGVEDARAESVAGLPQITIDYNKDKLALYGLNVSDLNEVVRMGFAGSKAGVVYEQERKFDLVVRLKKEFRNEIEDIQNLYITLPSGSQIPLEQVADIDYKKGPAQISREEGKRRIIVGFNVRGRDVESVVKEIQSKIDQRIELPIGYYIKYAGQFENLERAKSRLSIAVPVALALIFVLLHFTFNSIVQSLLIFTAIPLSAIGGIFALWLRDMPFSISAGIGFIALFGVAVLNGIVLIAFFNQLKTEGIEDIIERIKTGTTVRLRPVIMTASVASLGFLPMALSTSAGAEVQKPLATVVIGGLITATLLTLLILPILYYYSERKYKTTKMNISKSSISILLFCLMLVNFGACQQDHSDHDHEDHASHEGHVHGDEENHDDHEHEAAENKNKIVHLNEAQFINASIDTGSVSVKNLSDVIHANGYTKLDPQDQAEVSMPINGTIQSIKVIEGNYVKKGQLLATMMSLDLNEQMLQKSELEEEVSIAESKLIFLQKELERQKELVESFASPRKELERISTDVQTERVRIKAAQQQIQFLNNTLNLFNANDSAYIPIVAPISGHITDVHLKIGETVASGTNMFAIVDNSKMHVDLLVYEKDLYKVEVGQKVRFMLTNQSNQEIEGEIYNIGKSFANDTKSVAVHADIEKNEANLIPGMYINALIDIGEEKVAALPETAIVMAEGRTFVFVLQYKNPFLTNGKEKDQHEAAYSFERIEVKTGAKQLGFVAVTMLQAINPEEKIVLNGSYYLQSHLQKAEGGGGHHH